MVICSTSVASLYSMRRPEIARAITSCWISLVPSKMVWIRLLNLTDATSCRAVHVTWCYANGRFRLVSLFHLVLGTN